VRMHVLALMTVPVAVDAAVLVAMLVRVADSRVVVPVRVLALVAMVVRVRRPVGVNVLVRMPLVVMRVLALVVVPVLVHAAVRVRVRVHVPVRMRMVPLVDMRVGTHGAVGVPVLVGVSAFALDPGLALAATAGGAHDSFLCKAGFGIQDSGFRIRDSGSRIQDSGSRARPSFPNGEF